jgi:tetratricopeptide (TPR) repeat protein
MAAAAGGQEKDHASWWVTRYGLIDVAKEPRAARAGTIFERLAAAADKRANRFPRLAILDADGAPFAMALPDGTILLTRGALRICYQNASLATGDARLAFVLGHELSHLGNDDFWHAAAFEAVSLHGEATPSRVALTNLFEDSPDDAVKRELHADAFGMLYMTNAGYDPQILFLKGSFFEEWAQELDTLGVRAAAGHPKPQERGAFIRTQLAAITGELDYYHFGVRLVQLGRYQDGLLLLERFRDRFPSREVLNNIGVAHYQLAARYLGNCDGRLVIRFLLPTVVDPSTRAVRLRSGGASSPCFQAERFRLHFREAEVNLREASEMDPVYAPARMNLLSLFVLAEQGAQAIVAAEDAKKLAAEDPRVQSGAAVALYLYGESSGIDTANAAIDQLQDLRRLHPESIEAAYNLASLLAERRRVKAAEDVYRAFLDLDSRSIFADAARDYLGIPPTTPGEKRNADAPLPPVPLGPMVRKDLRARFPELVVEDFVVGDFSGSFLRQSGIRALVIDETIELVEEELEERSLSLSEALRRWGPPRRESLTPVSRVLHYRGFALEAIGESIARRFFFSESG